MIGMARRKGGSVLGEFHKDAAARGLTYAEAQMQETCSLIGEVRAPKGKQPDGRIYSRISERIREGNAENGEKTKRDDRRFPEVP